MVRDGPFRPPPPAGHNPAFNAFIALTRPACRPCTQVRVRLWRSPRVRPASEAAMPVRQCSRFRSREFRKQKAKTVAIWIAVNAGLAADANTRPGWRSDDAEGCCHRKRHPKHHASERRTFPYSHDGRLLAADPVSTMRSRAAACAWPKTRRLPATATRQRLASGPIRRRAERLGRFRCKTARGHCSHTLVLIGNVNRGILVKGTPGRK